MSKAAFLSAMGMIVITAGAIKPKDGLFPIPLFRTKLVMARKSGNDESLPGIK